MNYLRSFLFFGFTVLLVFAVANCSPIAEESDGLVAVGDLQGAAGPINDITGHERVKRGVSCGAFRLGCILSCQLHNCASGYCAGGWFGTCECIRCTLGRGTYQG